MLAGAAALGRTAVSMTCRGGRGGDRLLQSESLAVAVPYAAVAVPLGCVCCCRCDLL